MSNTSEIDSSRWGNLDGEFIDDVHERPVRVYFEDTDFSGVVYHAAYLKFLERGRSDFMRVLKVSHAALSEQGMAFGVSHMDIKFIAGAAIDDLLVITTKIEQYTSARVIFQQTVLRADTAILQAKVTIALIKNGRPQRLPQNIRQLFDEITG